MFENHIEFKENYEYLYGLPMVQQLLKRIKELEDKFLSKERNDKLAKIKNIAKEKGYDDDFADLQAQIFEELYSTVASNNNGDLSLTVSTLIVKGAGSNTVGISQVLSFSYPIYSAVYTN